MRAENYGNRVPGNTNGVTHDSVEYRPAAELHQLFGLAKAR
jgi:hypothetical protein